uniref:Uncharacterized protein n=1 Tax=Ditylenchus dipsaci TaxID=166011 RepID=A0A915EER3_9BILA
MENPPDQHDILTTTNNNVDTSFSKDNRNSSSRSWNGAAAEKTAGMSSCEEVVRNGVVKEQSKVEILAKPIAPQPNPPECPQSPPYSPHQAIVANFNNNSQL